MLVLPCIHKPTKRWQRRLVLFASIIWGSQSLVIIQIKMIDPFLATAHNCEILEPVTVGYGFCSFVSVILHCLFSACRDRSQASWQVVSTWVARDGVGEWENGEAELDSDQDATLLSHKRGRRCTSVRASCERYSQVNLWNSSRRRRSAIDVMRRRKDLLDVFSLLPSFLVLFALPGRPVCLSARLFFWWKVFPDTQEQRIPGHGTQGTGTVRVSRQPGSLVAWWSGDLMFSCFGVLVIWSSLHPRLRGPPPHCLYCMIPYTGYGTVGSGFLRVLVLVSATVRCCTV